MKIPTTTRSAQKIAEDFKKEAERLIGEGKAQYNDAVRAQKEGESKMNEGRRYRELEKVLKGGRR